MDLSKLISKKSKFEDVVKNREALKFHASRFESGQSDTLAKLCYQTIKLEEQNAQNKA